MTIYQDSKRIVGTNADRVGADAISGGWKELGRTTLGSGNSNIDVTSISDKRYYMLLCSTTGAQGNDNIHFRCGNGSFDSATSDYAYRYTENGASDSTSTSVNHIIGGRTQLPTFTTYYISNKSDKEKLWIGHNVYQSTAGAGTAPNRWEYSAKYTNVSNVINQIRATTTVSSQFSTGSEVVVLGYDPDDTHTDNFWEELDDSSWSTGSSWTSGTFTAKKYLWVQFYTEGGAGSSYFRFNGDSANNYANRYSINGGSDSTIASQPESYLGAIDGLSFHNLFIINNASNEKLFTHQRVSRSTAGAGNAPKRNEGAGKWANTSNQITSITVTTAGGGNLTAGNMKVWGSN